MSEEGWIEFVVGPQLPAPARRLASVVQQALKCSAHAAREAIHQGHVQVNRRSPHRTDLVLEPGDVVVVAPPQRQAETWGYRTTPADVEIRYVDSHLAVVVKPPGILTVPSPHREKNTLLHFLAKRLGAAETTGEVCCVHRLDRDVSGLLVFARSVAMAEALRDQFAARKPHRRYLALAAGTLQPSQGTFRSYLTTDAALNRHSVDDPAAGELAITHYEVQEVLGDVSLVSLRLETGRRNQIRVHLSEAGHPVLGESRYRPDEARHRSWPFRRIALHAAELGFDHPATGQRMHFDSRLPPEFASFFRAVRRAADPPPRRPRRPKRRS